MLQTLSYTDTAVTKAGQEQTAKYKQFKSTFSTRRYSRVAVIC